MDTLLMEDKRLGIRRNVVHCGQGGELKDGGWGMYLYITIQTTVYYPVNYVEIDLTRDVCF